MLQSPDWVTRNRLTSILLNWVYAVQTDREVGGLVSNLRSSFYGKVMYNQNFVTMKTNSSHGGRAVVASVVSTNSPFCILLVYIAVCNSRCTHSLAIYGVVVCGHSEKKLDGIEFNGILYSEYGIFLQNGFGFNWVQLVYWEVYLCV